MKLFLSHVSMVLGFGDWCKENPKGKHHFTQNNIHICTFCLISRAYDNWGWILNFVNSIWKLRVIIWRCITPASMKWLCPPFFFSYSSIKHTQWINDTNIPKFYPSLFSYKL